MTELLRQSLSDLAEDATVATPRANTWADARRSHRRRLVGGIAASTAAVLAVVTGSIALVAPSMRQNSGVTDQPAYVIGDLALPTNVSQPSPWESGTADAGPPGPLAVLGETLDRRTSWFHTSDAYYGISAVDGSYRYLDLPHLALNGTAVLSPDGTHVAYWTQSKTSTEQTTVDGYAVYDTTSGKTATHTIADRDVVPRLLVWAPGSNELMAAYRVGPLDDREAQVGKTDVLDVATDQSTVVALRHDVQPGESASWSANGIAFWRAPKLTVIDPQTGGVLMDLGLTPTPVGGGKQPRSGGVAWSPDLSTLAFAALYPKSSGPLLQETSLGTFHAGGVGAQLQGRDRPLGPPIIRRVTPFAAVYHLLGWRDDTHALVLGVPTAAQAVRADVVPGIYSINVETGDYERLASVSLNDSAWIRGIATSVSDHPFVNRPGPTSHRDPRTVWAVIAMVVLLSATVLFVVLRSRRSKDPLRPIGTTPT
ncbi:MAG TPA: hypothetical protein VLK34_00125 [Nocardioidaceae bacterium]|nr:hypothetical protein [Nocardioidaceae bacterium]